VYDHGNGPTAPSPAMARLDLILAVIALAALFGAFAWIAFH
jgi:hypothetical protein